MTLPESAEIVAANGEKWECFIAETFEGRIRIRAIDDIFRVVYRCYEEKSHGFNTFETTVEYRIPEDVRNSIGMLLQDKINEVV
jgi:hypothetical protein